jgi:hypothetical protein
VSLVLAEHSSKLAMDGLSFIPSGMYTQGLFKGKLNKMRALTALLARTFFSRNSSFTYPCPSAAITFTNEKTPVLYRDKSRRKVLSLSFPF